MRYATLQLQPVLDRRDFNREAGPKARSSAVDTLANGPPKFKDCGWLLLNRLCEGVTRNEEQSRK